MEDNTVPFVLLFGAVCVYVGIWIGRGIEAYRWCYHADKRIRMNSGGKLYKVREVR